MKRVLLIAAAVAVVMAMSVPAWAGTNPDCVFTLHAKAHTTKPRRSARPGAPTTAPRSRARDYVTNWPVGVKHRRVPRGGARQHDRGVRVGPRRHILRHQVRQRRGFRCRRVRLDPLRRPGVHQRELDLPARRASLRVADLRGRQSDHLGDDHQLPADDRRPPWACMRWPARSTSTRIPRTSSSSRTT